MDVPQSETNVQHLDDNVNEVEPQIDVKEVIKIKPKMNISYTDEDGKFTKAHVDTRAGKASGKHSQWWNITKSDGTKEAVNFDTLRDIQINASENQQIDLIMYTKTEEVNKAKLAELEQWKKQDVYIEEDDHGQESLGHLT